MSESECELEIKSIVEMQSSLSTKALIAMQCTDCGKAALEVVEGTGEFYDGWGADG